MESPCPLLTSDPLAPATFPLSLRVGPCQLVSSGPLPDSWSARLQHPSRPPPPLQGRALPACRQRCLLWRARCCRACSTRCAQPPRQPPSRAPQRLPRPGNSRPHFLPHFRRLGRLARPTPGMAPRATDPPPHQVARPRPLTGGGMVTRMQPPPLRAARCLSLWQSPQHFRRMAAWGRGRWGQQVWGQVWRLPARRPCGR